MKPSEFLKNTGLIYDGFGKNENKKLLGFADDSDVTEIIKALDNYFGDVK